MIDNYEIILQENSILNTDRLLLRPFTTDDVNAVFEYAKDEQTTKYLTWYAHKSIDESLKTINEYFTSRSGIYAIELKTEQKCIGCIDLRIEDQHDKANFGYVLNRKYWNKGYMSEALLALLHLSFDMLNLNRVESTHYVGNEGSGKVMQKCGMKYEGRGIQEKKIRGIYFDVLHYAILKKEWDNMHIK